MELSELSLRVEKLEEIIQELSKWTNFNLSTCQKDSVDWKTTHPNKQKSPIRARVESMAQSTSEISNALEADAEDPSLASVVIKMELEYDDEELANNIGEDLPEKNVDPLFIPSDEREQFESTSEFEEPPKKRRKRSTDKKYEPLKVPHKPSLPQSEPFVSLRPLTHSQLLLIHKKNRKTDDLKGPSCLGKFKTKQTFSSHVDSSICQRDARPFACPHCPYAAATKGTLSTHIQSRHPATEEEKSHRTFNNIRQHIKNNPKHCYFCTWKRKSLAKLTKHLRIHTREMPYKCPNCIYTYKRYKTMKIHMKDVHGSFQCSECPCKFKSKTSLERHLRVTHNAGDKCGICEFVGSDYTSLKEHQNCHKTKDGLFQCPHCPKMCKRRLNLVAHGRMHTGEKPYKCGKCSNAYRDEYQLTRHEITCQNKGHRPFACPHCPFNAAQKQNLSRHIKTVHPATEEERLHRPFKCPECPKTFRFKRDLSTHISYIHNKTGETFLCDSCPYLGNNINNFRQHMYSYHKEISFFCYFCAWKGRRLEKLTTHLRTHTGEKPYKCPHCIYSSAQQGTLKIHVKFVHNKEEGPFQCSKCSGRFKTKGALAKHLKIHDGWKCGICGVETFTEGSVREHLNSHKTEDGMFQCHHCPKMCKRRDELTYHIRSHTGEKPYECGKCEYASARKDVLRNHEKICEGNRRKKPEENKEIKDGEELPEDSATVAPTAEDKRNYWNEFNFL